MTDIQKQLAEALQSARCCVQDGSAVAERIDAALAAHRQQEARGPLDVFDEAIAAELPRVSHVEYDSHEICKHFAAEVRKRIAAHGIKGE